MQTAYKANNQYLNAYYGGLDTIEKYYQSQARADLRKTYGENVYEIYYAYLDLITSKEKKEFKRLYPYLDDFIREKNDWQEIVNRKTVELSTRFPDLPGVPVRDPQSATQAMLAKTVNQTPDDTAAKIQQEMSPALFSLVQDYWQKGEDMPYAARQQLDYIGENYGMNANEVLQLMGTRVQ